MRVLGLLLLAVFTLSSFAKDEKKAPAIKPPKGILDSRMRDDYVKADPYIRAIVDQHEAAFPGALAHASYFFYADLNRISYIQQGLVMELMGTPGFQEAFRTREPMTDIAVTVTKTSEVEALKFNAEEWNEFVEGDVLEGIADSQKRLKNRGKPRPSVELVLEDLRKELFDSWNFAWEPSENWDVSNKLKPFVVLATLARQHPAASLKALKDMIKTLDVGAMDYFQDPMSWKPIFKGMEQWVRGDKKAKFPSDLEAAMANTYEDLNDDVYDEGANVALTIGDSVTIREVHPNFSIFRGYVGNDCATCFSPGFVLNPFDRYYYVFDEKGKRLGYAGLSIVKIEEKKTLVLHTIQGPDFTEKQTQLVMRAFKKAAPSLEAEHVVLSSDYNINHNVNFAPIRRTMISAVAGQPELKLTWKDMAFRKIIAKWDSEMTYDDPKANPTGRELPFSNEEVEVAVSQTPFDFTLTASTPEMIEAAKKDCRLRLSNSGSGSSGGFGGYW